MNRLAKHAVLLLLSLLFFTPSASRADVLGDTLHIGYTCWENPQPFSNPYSIEYYPDYQGGEPHINYLWFRQPSVLGTVFPKLSRIYLLEDEVEVSHDYFSTSHTGPVLGGVLMKDSRLSGSIPIIVQNVEYETEGYRPWFCLESLFVEGFYDQTPYRDASLGDTILGEPHGVMGLDSFIHTVQTTCHVDSTANEQTWYRRWFFVVDGWNFIPQTPILVSDAIRVPASDIAVSIDGSHVALALLIPRDEETGDRESLLRSNNDLFLYESWDSGSTWNWDNPTNITNWIAPDANLLPDSTHANQDTLRAVRDATLYIDEDDVVHVFFTVSPMDYYREELYDAGMIYHWDSSSETYVLVADGSQLEGRPDETGYSVDSPAFLFDNDYGLGYLVFRRVSTEEAPHDTANGFACTDLYLSVGFSPSDQTLLAWTQPIRLTGTNWTTPGVPMTPGQAQSEMRHSLLPRFNDDFLYMSYTVDRWPGLESDSDDVLNDIVLQEMFRQDIHDELNDQWGTGSWEWPGVEMVRNYPLHVDSTGFFEWEWEHEHDVPPDVTQPDEFDLHPVSPNPFNPSTRITFALGSRQTVELAVYDVLGRQVAELVNRPMQAGSHTVLFYGADLPSGMYFCKLTVGGESRMQKMVLMK